jgi:NAD(P)-dependent dehydrogenase (short-subunit alcohol dehydrogenase family)
MSRRALALPGRTVLVTGAARGIGAHTARLLAQRGANVALVGLEPELLEDLAAQIGERAAAFTADVTDREALGGAVDGVVERFGGVDAVIANAGIASFGTVAVTDPDAFARTIEINLLGVFYTVRAALPHVIARRGHILVVSSVAAFAPSAGMAAYCASKAGAEALASSLSSEVAHHGVTVGSVHPSWIDTDMVRDAAAELEGFRRMRKLLPWPVHATTSVEACAAAIADGVERRAQRVYVPRSVALLYWLRPLLQNPRTLRLVGRGSASIVPGLEDEIRSLGRSMSKRTLETQESAKVA